jgi:hypothetical protein
VPTVALILVGLCTVKVRAAVPPKLTAVAPVKLVPVMVTTCPVFPDVGVNEVMVGGMAAPIKVKPVIVPTPLAVVTLILPVAPAPITAVMEVALTTLNEVAAVPPKLTAVAPVKLVPVNVTVCPVLAEVGLKELIAGGGK